MMGPITCGVQLFLRDAPYWGPELARSRKACLAIMHAMVSININWILCYPRTPSLYCCDGRDDTHPKVVYKPEPPGQEVFDSIPMVMARGNGDCDDLAVWRCAELRVAGIKASPWLKWRVDGPNQHVYHACVRWPDGKIEDPSLALGMAGHTITRKSVWIEPGPGPEPDEQIPEYNL